MELNIKKLSNTAHIPTKGSNASAGLDLYADLDRPEVLYPGTTKMIHTGLAMAIPEGYFGAVYARSGIATKRGLRPANCVGVVDSDYRGEVMVALHSDSADIQMIEPGERIAQLVIMPYLSVNIMISDDLDETDRGEGGFGSTGVN